MALRRWPPRIAGWREIGPGHWTFGVPQEYGYVEKWDSYVLKREQSCYLCKGTLSAGTEVFVEWKLQLVQCRPCKACPGEA